LFGSDSPARKVGKKKIILVVLQNAAAEFYNKKVVAWLPCTVTSKLAPGTRKAPR